MSTRRDPLDRLVDVAVAVPWSMTVAISRAVPAVWRAAQRRALPVVDAFAEEAVAPAADAVTSDAAPLVGRIDESAVDELVDERADADADAADAGADGDDAAEVGLTADELPIEDYDALAARQVVARLADLFPEELDAVERYEIAHRHRQTVLHRIAQLRT